MNELTQSGHCVTVTTTNHMNEETYDASHRLRQTQTKNGNCCNQSKTSSPSMHHHHAHEPMYATVKRTAGRTAVTRQTDSSHVYQYPLTLIGPTDSCFDSGDRYLTMQTADAETDNSIPLLVSEDGRHVSVTGTIRSHFPVHSNPVT